MKNVTNEKAEFQLQLTELELIGLYELSKGLSNFTDNDITLMLQHLAYVFTKHLREYESKEGITKSMICYSSLVELIEIISRSRRLVDDKVSILKSLINNQ